MIRRLLVVSFVLAFCACTPGTQHLTYVVTVPANTPATDTLYVLGSDPALGAWTMPGTPMTRRSDGTYVLELDLPVGSHGSSMITRGTWRTIERSANSQPAPDRAYTLGKDPVEIDATVGQWLDQSYNTLTGNIEHINGVTSQYVATRNVIVYLPPGYDDAANADARYPVLYMHDGQNLFDASTAYAGEWNADATAERLINAGTIAPLIIVGVYNVGPKRIHDYTPVPDPDYPEGGGADAYANFLIQELKPMIDARYRTLPDAANTGVGGSSLGGLVSAYFGLTHSDVFSRIVAMSPSVWWDSGDIVNRVNAIPEKLPLTIWEDIGTAEGSTPDVDLGYARNLRDAFVGKGWVLDDDLHYDEAAGAGHNETAWSQRFPMVLQALYPR